MDTHLTHKRTAVPDDWFAAAFGELYPVVYAHRTDASAVPEARFAASSVGLTCADAALDLCCGSGRHLAALEQYGARLTGVDYSPQLLATARKKLAPHTGLLRADMRALPFEASFDVLFSFFTSFGYFLDDADNVGAAFTMARVLKPGGRFFMDYLNPLSLGKHLEPESRRLSQGYDIHERRWIDEESRRVNKTIAVSRDGVALGELAESVRLYTREELTGLLSEAGVRVENVYGDCTGAAYNPETSRMVLVGVRTAS